LRDWIEAIGDPDKPDEIFDCMLEAADCFQGANFNFLHGYYRTAMAELRVALELVLTGAFGQINPTNKDYGAWKSGASDVSLFNRFRKTLSGTLKKGEAKWLFADGALLDVTYRKLCNYTHSRYDSNYGVLWRSNGPVYNNDAIWLTFTTALLIYALCYLLVRLARPKFTIPADSDVLFELDWIQDYATLVSAYTELLGTTPKPPLEE
jgi:hypothetical protein